MGDAFKVRWPFQQQPVVAEKIAVIGGRGTGKSTILEYLRWGLCDQPVDDIEHMLAQLGRVADDRLGAGVWSFDRGMRQIPDHFHAHARDPDWWFRRFGRR